MLNEDTAFFQASIAIKLRFPSPMTQNYWAIEEQSRKTTYAVPFLAILITSACAMPINKRDLLIFLNKKYPIDIEKFENILESLVTKKIIFSTNGSKKDSLPFAAIRKWKDSGWDDAADYHFFTWDAPFLDYSLEGKGHEKDRKKMIHYQELQPDTQRLKKYNRDLPKISLPSFEEISSTIQAKKLSILDKVKELLSLTFGKRGEKPCHWSNIPLVRRTSPSGGSRHPTEGYFLACNLEGIAKGFYHVQTDLPSLQMISSLIQFEIEKLIPSDKDNASVIGAIILTSVFERNMYRYREPRTFRTIHMDVGHLLATIEMLGKEFNIRTHIHLHMNEKEILKHIATSKLEEGVMAVVTLSERS